MLVSFSVIQQRFFTIYFFQLLILQIVNMATMIIYDNASFVICSPIVESSRINYWLDIAYLLFLIE